MIKESIMDEQGLAFDRVILPKSEPASVIKDKNEDYYIQIKAEKAKEVKFTICEKEYPCDRTRDGIWRMKCPFHTGIHYVQLWIDEIPVLSPYLPIGYGCSRPYNYVELPPEGEDFYCIKDVPHGEVRKSYFYSAVTSSWSNMVVYTPPCYEKEAEREFPVLYLQHGHGENEMGWTIAGKVNWILDNLLAEGKIKPFIVVMNNGMVQIDISGQGHVVDHTLFEKRLLEDIIPFVENHFRVKKNKENRAMAGLSMGSMQTALVGFSHPEHFCAIGLFSGFMRDFIQGSELDMINREASDQSHLKILDDAEKFRSEFKLFFRAIGDHDLFLDEFQTDDRICEAKGITCERKIYSGIHDWNVWRMCIRDFAQMIFK